MPIGDTARSAIWDYLREREALMPRIKALGCPSRVRPLLPNGICQILKRLAKRANIEACIPTVSAILTNQRPAGWNARGGAENSRRVEEDPRDLLQDSGRVGRH